MKRARNGSRAIIAGGGGGEGGGLTRERTNIATRNARAGCHTYVRELYPINQRNRPSCNRGGHSIMIALACTVSYR